MSKKGFTLIEILVTVAIFSLVALGIYGVITYGYKIILAARVRVLETQLANERVEIIRNLPYEQVGTIGGVPTGIIDQTTTTIRSKMQFQITTTIRNVDDPFDGTLGGTPNDTAPADYKMAQISVWCSSCSAPQVTPVIFTTLVAPKGLESASQNGALFLKVFDAAGNLLPNAQVHITNTKVSPAINITDVTNVNGAYQLVDTPTSTWGYNIQVTKNGYTIDSTLVPTQQNPNPVKPPATVVSQNITNISFSIDQVSAINLSTLNNQCQYIPSIGFQVNGSKLSGTNPDIYKYNQTITTNSGGLAQINNLDWDTYFFNLNNISYDIAGTIPTLPVTINPGATQNLSIILQPHTTNSLLLTIKDNGTKLPLSEASVTLTSGNNSWSGATGHGYLRQTDWSGGSGQETFLDNTKYSSQDGDVETNNPAGDLQLKKIGNNYNWSGYLLSSTIDFGQASNFTNIIWEPLSQPPQAGADSIKFQLATSASSSPASWSFLGPDGTSGTYYTTSNSNISSVHNSDRYLRYKVFLNTTNQSFTPQLSEVAISYTSGCTPPGQVFFPSLSSGTYNLNISLSGYQAVDTSVDVSGATQDNILMSP